MVCPLGFHNASLTRTTFRVAVGQISGGTRGLPPSSECALPGAYKKARRVAPGLSYAKICQSNVGDQLALLEQVGDDASAVLRMRPRELRDSNVFQQDRLIYRATTLRVHG